MDQTSTWTFKLFSYLKSSGLPDYIFPHLLGSCKASTLNICPLVCHEACECSEQRWKAAFLISEWGGALTGTRGEHDGRHTILKADGLSYKANQPGFTRRTLHSFLSSGSLNGDERDVFSVSRMHRWANQPERAVHTENRWFSDTDMNYMEGLLKQIPGPCSQSFWLGTWRGAWAFVVLTSSQVMLLVLRPHFEDYSFKNVDNDKEHLLNQRRPQVRRWLFNFLSLSRDRCLIIVDFFSNEVVKASSGLSACPWFPSNLALIHWISRGAYHGTAPAILSLPAAGPVLASGSHTNT